MSYKGKPVGQYVEEMDRRRAAPTDPCAAGFTFHIAGRRPDSRLRSCPVNSRANPWRTYRKMAGLRRFSNQPVAEIVQRGEPFFLCEIPTQG